MGPGASPANSLWVENDNVHRQGTAKAIAKEICFLKCVLQVCLKGGMQGNFVGCLSKLSFTGPHLDNFLIQRTVNAVCRAQSSISLSHFVGWKRGGSRRQIHTHHGEAVAAEAAVLCVHAELVLLSMSHCHAASSLCVKW